MRLPEPALGADHPVNLIRAAWAAIETFCASSDCPQPAKYPVAFVLAGFRIYEEGVATGMTLDRAFSLAKGRGGAAWVKQQKIVDRNRLLRNIRTHHLGALSDADAASAIRAELAAMSRRQDLRDGTFAGDLARAELLARVPRSKQLEAILFGNPMHD